MKKTIIKTILFTLSVCLFIGMVWAQDNDSKEKDKRPEASGTAVWNYLQKEDYTKNWHMWPGTSAFYPGKSPHGALLTTYVNEPAYEAILKKAGDMPEGAIICKQNFDKEKNYLSLTVMYKVNGYNPTEGNYFWGKYAPDGNIEASGKINSCINCHNHQRENDFVFTSSLK